MSDQDSHPESRAYSSQQPVFLHRGFAGLTGSYADPEFAATVILPVPYDATSEWQSGSRHGPQAIIDASQYLELYDLDLDLEPYRAGIATLPQMEPVLGNPEAMVDRVYQVVNGLIQKGKLVVMLGGEHSISLGAVRAFRERFTSLSVLQLDAHADLRNEYLGTGYGQACVMRRIHELCPITQAGVRSLSSEEKQFMMQNRLTPFFMSSLTTDPACIPDLVKSLTDDVYVTIDVDVLDPSIMPAVGTPEPDGMTWRQLMDILKSVARHKNIVGFDLVEFCPGQGLHSCAFLLAKLAYRLIGCALPPGSIEADPGC